MRNLRKFMLCMVLIVSLICTQLLIISAEDSVECSIKYTKAAKELINTINEVNRSDSFGITLIATTSDYDNLKVCNVPVYGSIEVKVIKGTFYSARYGDTRPLLWFSEPQSGAYVNTLGCDVINEPQFTSSDDLRNYYAVVRVQGKGETVSTTSSITFSAALELVNKAGIKVSIPGFGEVNGESQLKTAFGGATTKTVNVTITTNFNAYYDTSFAVTGLGSINVTVQ